MLNIGNKVYRNMQEQVAYNSECIQKIKEYLDGLEYSDSLIVLTSSSGSLTAEEMAVAEKKVAFIYLNGELYVKSEDVVPSSYIFRQVKLKATEVGSAYYEIGGSKIVVTIGTATYAQSDEVVITVYSKSQVDSIVANIMAIKANVADVYTKTAVDLLLAGKADLSGANFTGDVTAPTLEQANANATLDTTITPPTGCVVDSNSFAAMKVVNGVLYVIFEARISNNTGASVTDNVSYTTTNIPVKYSSKIFRKDGTKVSEAYVSSSTVCNFEAVTLVENSGSRQIVGGILSSYSANRIGGYIPNVTIPDGKYIDVAYRFPIILL